MDTRRRHLAREIARLEAALDSEGRALHQATNHNRRGALPRLLMTSYTHSAREDGRVIVE